MKRMRLTLAVCGLLLASLAGHPAWAATTGDINGDGRVDATDLLAMAGSWGKSTGQPGFDSRCDLNGNGKVNVTDLPLLADNWPPDGMVLISGGSFPMGDSFSEGNSDELPVRAVNLSPYYMDTCEVTNAQYAAALNWAYAQGGHFDAKCGCPTKELHGMAGAIWRMRSIRDARTARAAGPAGRRTGPSPGSSAPRPSRRGHRTLIAAVPMATGMAVAGHLHGRDGAAGAGHPDTILDAACRSRQRLHREAHH